MTTLTMTPELENAITQYRLALDEYEYAAELPSYAAIELPKLRIADAVLRSLGIATGPSTSGRKVS